MNVRLVYTVAISLLLLCFFIVPQAVETAAAGGEKPTAEHPEVPRISADAVRKLFNEGKVLLVNTQEENGQEKSMILGAIGAPGGLINGSEIHIPDNLMVVFYCM
jgi:hypothetical protein